eukprot:4844959-Alexandrium_andersonii.AAC.1
MSPQRSVKTYKTHEDPQSPRRNLKKKRPRAVEIPMPPPKLPDKRPPPKPSSWVRRPTPLHQNAILGTLLGGQQGDD